MITHFAQLKLPTVSVQGVKQFYKERLHFPIVYETENEIHFRPTPFFTLQFEQRAELLAPAHFAFEVPFSRFAHAADCLQKAGIPPLQWADGRSIDTFDTGKNIYFRDGDGNLLELIAHTYIKEGILPTSGPMGLLYLREIGFPVDSVTGFRERFVSLFDFRLGSVSDTFTFAIGGTAHAVVASKQRKWIPIGMTALPPRMEVTFGVGGAEDLDEAKRRLQAQGIPYEELEAGLAFELDGYSLRLQVTAFPEDSLSKLGLPHWV